VGDGMSSMLGELEAVAFFLRRTSAASRQTALRLEQNLEKLGQSLERSPKDWTRGGPLPWGALGRGFNPHSPLDSNA
jgi:hypothetical protein